MRVIRGGNRVGGYQTFVSEDGPVLSSFFLQLRGDSNQFSFTVPYDFFVLAQSCSCSGVGFDFLGFAGSGSTAAATAATARIGVAASAQMYNGTVASAAVPPFMTVSSSAFRCTCSR